MAQEDALKKIEEELKVIGKQLKKLQERQDQLLEITMDILNNVLAIPFPEQFY